MELYERQYVMLNTLTVCTCIGFGFLLILDEGMKVPHTSASSWLVYNICKDDISDHSTPR